MSSSVIRLLQADDITEQLFQATNTDLSTVAGETVGASLATDDGTNTPSGHAEVCLWVDRDGNGDTAWQVIGSETYIEVN